MNVEQLREHLSKFPWHLEVMLITTIGKRRDISLGPTRTTINQTNVDSSPDCAGRKNEDIVVIG